MSFDDAVLIGCMLIVVASLAIGVAFIYEGLRGIFGGKGEPR